MQSPCPGADMLVLLQVSSMKISLRGSTCRCLHSEAARSQRPIECGLGIHVGLPAGRRHEPRPEKWDFTKILLTCQDADTLGTEKD